MDEFKQKLFKQCVFNKQEYIRKVKISNQHDYAAGLASGKYAALYDLIERLHLEKEFYQFLEDEGYEKRCN